MDDYCHKTCTPEILSIMALMFSATPSIQRAVDLMNQLDANKFPLILSRILQKLHLKDERAFSEEEEERLQSALSLNEADLQSVLETCEFFLHQAVYHTAKPGVLSQQLSKLKLDDDKTQAIVDAWTNGAKSITEKLRHRSIMPKQLDDVSWALHLDMGSKNQSKLKESNASLQLTLKDEDSSSSQPKEKICIEFSHSELYKFYNQLETIQSQLDELS